MSTFLASCIVYNLLITITLTQCDPTMDIEYDTIPAHHTVVNVATVNDLNNAILYAQNHTTVLIESGTYNLTGLPNQRLRTPTYRINDILIRSKTSNYQDVIIVGTGQYNSLTQNGIEIFEASNLVIASLTIKEVYYHCIQIHSGYSMQNQNITLYNLHLLDAGQQIIKINPDNGIGAKNVYIFKSIIELTNGWNTHPVLGYAYGNGISAHRTQHLVIRDCIWKELWYSPLDGGLSGPAILVWNNAKDTVIERNKFYNCARGIAIGLGGSLHYGGVVRNNMFYRDSIIGDGAVVDVAFYIESIGYTQVIQNTIIVQDSYYAPIEIRYDYTNDTFISNNIVDTGIINQRDAAVGRLIDNDVGHAVVSWFMDMNNGDLHLVSNSETQIHVIAKGSMLEGAEYDFDGQLRNVNGVDLGADEISDITCTDVVVSENDSTRTIRDEHVAPLIFVVMFYTFM